MTRNFKKIPKLLFFSLIILSILSGGVLAQPDDGEKGKLSKQNEIDVETTVSLVSLPNSVSDCGVLDLYIDVNDVTNLYGVDVRLSFDPNIIEIVDFTPTSAQVTIEPLIDPALNFDADYWVRNIVDNFRGTLWYAASSLNPTPAATGSGHIAHLKVRAKANGDPNFAWTYIKLSNPNGVEIPATGTFIGALNATTDVVPELDIIRVDASKVELQWTGHATTDVTEYKLYRSTTPYFYAQETLTPLATITNTGAALTYQDASLGSADDNHFYALRAVCTGVTDSFSAASNQVGEFEYQLYETAGTDFNMIGLVLDVEPDWTKAKTLAEHIMANSTYTAIDPISDPVTVKAVQKFNAVAQNWTTYTYPFPLSNYDVLLKQPYRVEIEVPGSEVSVIWAQVGRLPAITTDTYILEETAGTDFNWILQPLDMTGINRAKLLAEDIIYNSSAPVSVLTVELWNATSQNFTTYNRQQNYLNFVTRFGYPYRVEVNVNTGTSVTWP